MINISVENLHLHYPIHKSHSRFQSQSGEHSKIRRGKHIDYVHALQNVSFDIKSGQRVGLIGSNGSGKSTLLRVLAGIYHPTRGSVIVNGRISSIFNINLGMRPEATGRQNIYIRGIIAGMRRRDVKAKIDEIISFSELEEFIDMPLRTYSSGMSMRLAFSIATSFSPEVILLDEWIGTGDRDFQIKASKRMNSLVDQAAITVIASHNRALLKRVCDSGIWMENGELKASGPIAEVYSIMDDVPEKK